MVIFTGVYAVQRQDFVQECQHYEHQIKHTWLNYFIFTMFSN